jgi:hypothetical protein
MTQCQCKAGFFSLRDCENMAIGQCVECARWICGVHSASEVVIQTCRDCKARRDQANGTTGDSGTYDDGWAHSYRERYYGAGYTPIYSGSHRRHYDDQDAQGFVARDGEAGEMEDGTDDPQAGFGDS